MMKTFLIIGGASGIGLALTKLLLEEGHLVFTTYHQQKLDLIHDNLTALYLDVMDDEPDLSLLPDGLDGLVYCPGAINLKPFARIKPDDFVADYELQVTGAVRMIQYTMDKLKAVDQSSIVLFSSVAASMGFNFHSLVSASKAALEGLMRALAAELAPKIRVNVIAPSITNTPLAAKYLSTEEKIKNNDSRHPLKRIGQPEDIAQSASFLLSENATWMTGQVLHLDGGMSTIIN